jgi:O-antigen/teichoic acid export membrane protein
MFLQMMLLVVLANTLWYTSSVVHGAFNKHQAVAVYFLVGTGMSLLIARFLIPHWGLLGVPVALLMIDIMMSTYVLRKSLTWLDDSFGNFLTSLFTLPDVPSLGRLLPRRS